MKTFIPLFLTSLAFVFLSIAAPRALAVNPPPDGGYLNGNTAEGENALLSLTTGSYNTALGFFALGSDTDSSFNTAVGAASLLLNTGSLNTALGTLALLLNSTGSENTAVGNDALLYNDIGNDNNAFGVTALLNNTQGYYNNAYGHAALHNNVDGYQNNAFGDDAMYQNTRGSLNAAFGDNALFACLDGGYNVAIGAGAGANVIHGSDNVYIGRSASGPVDESRYIRIGDTGITDYDCFIAGIYGRQYGPADMAVRIGNDGKIGTVLSSTRFKHDIKPIDKGSEAIMALKPVTFHYNSDETNTPRVGLIAEDVAKVSPDLVIPDKEGRPLSVRYEDVNVMLLNEFLKEHRKVEKLETTVADLAAQLQRVTARIQMADSASQVAASDR